MQRTLPLPIALSLFVLIAAASGAGGFFYAKKTARAAGFTAGNRNGFERGKKAAKKECAAMAMVTTRDLKHPPEKLLALPSVQALGALNDTEKARLVHLLNVAPTPCSDLALRGISLATSLLDDKKACPAAVDQLPLAFAVLRTMPDDLDALTVMKVERRRSVDISDSPIRGPKDAPITIVEWADFECPFCARAEPFLAAQIAKGNVRIAFKNKPLRMHKVTISAHLAAEAARQQGKFWEMHDALFQLGTKGLRKIIDPADTVPATGPVYFENIAKSLGMDVEKYRTDFRSPKTRAHIDADVADSDALKVTGTPTYWINNMRVTGRPTQSVFDTLMARSLAEQQGHFKWDIDDVKTPAKKDIEAVPMPNAAKAPTAAAKGG